MQSYTRKTSCVAKTDEFGQKKNHVAGDFMIRSVFLPNRMPPKIATSAATDRLSPGDGRLAHKSSCFGGLSMSNYPSFRLLLVFILATAFSSGCSRNRDVQKVKYVESGQWYFQKGKYREAVIQFSNAIETDPQYGDAHYQLAQAYLKLGQWRPAYQELSRTLELQPANYGAHLDIANLLIAGGDFKQAEEHTGLLLRERPNDPQVYRATAKLRAGQGNVQAAIEEMQNAIALVPNDAGNFLDLAMLQMTNHQLDLAESNFKTAVELNPKDIKGQLALGTYFQSRNRFYEAEQQFRHAIALDPKNTDPPTALVRLYILEGKKKEAEDFLKLVKPNFPDDSVGYRMLGDYYFATGDLDKASAEYGSLYLQYPQDLQVKKNYVQLLILKDKLPVATALNEEILKANTSDNDALICRGQIQIREGRSNDAVQTLQSITSADPDNAGAHYYLGLAFNALGKLEQAESEWQNAVRLRPDLAEAEHALAVLAMRKGDMAMLAEVSTKIIALQPTSPDGYALRAFANINRKQFARAEEDARKAVEVAPQDSAGYIQMGNLRRARRQFSNAEKSYQQALQCNPASADALSGLMTTYLAQHEIDQAVAAANTQIAKVPNQSGFYNLLGRLLFDQKKNLNGARDAFRKAASLDKNNSDALFKLGQVEVALGSADEALATYQASLKDNPHEVALYILIGELYESKQDWSQAMRWYQKALEITPGNPLASNNLAYLMLQTGGNMDLALSLAQTARRGMPDSPNAADTLGWVFYEKGAYKAALDLFQEALKLGEKNRQPDDPTVHYHLGLAYEKTAQPALARQQLLRVLKIDPHYRDAAEVKKHLAQLQP